MSGGSENNISRPDGMMKEADSIIAKHMLELSHEDREKSYLDLHGVTNGIQETPSLIKQHAELLDVELSIMKGKNAYNRAASMDLNYVQNPAFRLKFLRGERFNAVAAANKIVKFFEVKEELFGVSKLVKDITQNDLEEQDLECLYKGYIQWLPMKDLAGRRVYIMFPLQAGKFPIESRLRVSFYLRTIANEDIEFQKNGAVCILSACDIASLHDFDLLQTKDAVDQTTKLGHALPGNTHAIHVCFDNLTTWAGYIFSLLIQSAVLALNPVMKVRMRIHRCSPKDALPSFGIPTDKIPKSPDDNEAQTNLLKQRKLLEDERERLAALMLQNPNSTYTEEHLLIPGPYDVLFLRGRNSNEYPGNYRFRGFIEDMKSIYDKSSKNDKTCITIKIVKAIKTKGRFLKAGKLGWVEVDDKTARLKASHAFRDLSRTSNFHKGNIEGRSKKRKLPVN